MILKYNYFLILSLFTSCETGKLTVIADVPDSLDEVSAVETIVGSDLIWTIEDAGNKNNIYGIDSSGKLVKDIDVSTAKNIDWEDLTSDTDGNIYIGDFGNNSRKRKLFTIYKISNISDAKYAVTAEKINFTLPKTIKSEDFEAFFIYNNYFYIFSKAYKKSILIKVPNKMGNQVAEFVTDFNLKGKNNRVTSADISDDNKTIVLLNHDKLWTITNFKTDNFFDGDLRVQEFNHDSQKEGICFDKNRILITDERNNKNSNIYSFK